MRTFVAGLLLGAAVVVAAAFAIVPQVSGPAATGTPAATRTAAPTRSATATSPGAQLSAIDRALAQAAQSGRALPVTLTFTERDLTASAAAFFPQTMSGVTLTDPLVRTRAGLLTLDMTASAAFLRATASVVATVGVTNGRAATTVVSATIAGAQLPQNVTSDVKAQLDQALAAGMPSKFRIDTITVADGSLVVAGVANP